MRTQLVPTESQEADVLVAWLRIHHIKFTHVANETGHSPEAIRRAIRLKRQGVSKGFPDYLVFVDGQAVAVELKRLSGSETSPEQKEWIETLNDSGVPAKICRGADEAIEFIDSWRTHVKKIGQEMEVF